MDAETRQIAEDAHAQMIGQRVIALVERDGFWEVHQHTADGVCPVVAYHTPQLAASRVLQLLHIGPVRPQTHPETAVISSIAVESRP